MVVINVTTARAVCLESPHPLTSGMVGQRCRFVFSSDWDGLTKNAVITGSNVTKVVLNVQDDFVIPWECLTIAGTKLEIGVEGRSDDGTVVIPTVSAYIGKIMIGVDDNAEESVPPTPSQVQQLQAEINAESAKRAQAIESAIDAEKAERQAADESANVEIEALKASKATSAALDQETQARAAADSALSDAINNEAESRAATDTALANAIASKQDKLKAGANITIAEDGTISATGGGQGGGAVDSVNGKTGAVVLNADDVGAAPADHNHNGTYQPVGDYAAAQHRHDASDIDNLTSGVSAVAINGTELPKDDDGVVEIPKSNGQTFGLVKSGTGVSSTNGTLNLVQASDYGLNNRTNTGAITPPILDKAVLASLTDGKSASLWTADKQAAARALLGVGGSGGGDEWTYTTFTTTEDTDAITVDIPTDFNELFLSFTNAITNASSGYKYAYCNFTGTQQGKMISTHGNMNIYVGSYKPSYRFRLERVGGSAFLVSYTVGNYASINTSYFPIIVDFGGQESSGKIILHTFNTSDKFLAGTVVELAYK